MSNVDLVKKFFEDNTKLSSFLVKKIFYSQGKLISKHTKSLWFFVGNFLLVKLYLPSVVHLKAQFNKGDVWHEYN